MRSATVPAWAGLDPVSKRDRLLEAAELVFADHGLDAPMPAVARAAGAGVGSIYRQFASKDELVAALAERRLREVEIELDAALLEDDPWAGLTGFLWRALERRPYDDVSSAAIATTKGSPGVREVRPRVHGKLDELIARARAAGSLRSDATRKDVTLIFLSARSVKREGPDAWRRVLELAIDGLRAGG